MAEHHHSRLSSSGRSAPTPSHWRGIVAYMAAAVIGPAVSPRLAWLRWPVGLGPRGLVAYFTCHTLLLFLLRQLVLPRVSRMLDEQERARDELRQQLGREPTEREEFEHLGVFRGRS